MQLSRKVLQLIIISKNMFGMNASRFLVFSDNVRKLFIVLSHIRAVYCCKSLQVALARDSYRVVRREVLTRGYGNCLEALGSISYISYIYNI